MEKIGCMREEVTGGWRRLVYEGGSDRRMEKIGCMREEVTGGWRRLGVGGRK
jgi:hypothetical protein